MRRDEKREKNPSVASPPIPSDRTKSAEAVATLTTPLELIEVIEGATILEKREEQTTHIKYHFAFLFDLVEDLVSTSKVSATSPPTDTEKKESVATDAA